MVNKARKVQELNDREVVRKRYPTWFGSNMPKTISAKELIDNGLDQIADGKATKCYVHLTNNSILVWDNGVGISTTKAEDGETFMYKAVAKLFTSTNYDDNQQTTGANGVGATATNYLSSVFQVVNLNSGKGYSFDTGYQVVNGETQPEDNHDYGVIDKTQIPVTDLAPEPVGFIVSAEYDNSILPEEINIDWLKDYLICRVGELGPETEVRLEIDKALTGGKTSYNEDDEDEGEGNTEGASVDVDVDDGTVKTVHEDTTFVKDQTKAKGGNQYLPSWEEKVSAIEGTELKKVPRLGITYAFINTENAVDEKKFRAIKPMVANAPVRNQTMFKGAFQIGETSVSTNIPYTFFIKSGKYPPYTDQTKEMITPAKAGIKNILKNMSKETYDKYYRIAEQTIVKKIVKAEDKENYWPPMAGRSKEPKELIVTEGYSAASGVKAMRNVKNQGILALCGKILNCRHKSLMSAMRSPVVKKFYSILAEGKYDRVIITTDADEDGSSICGLVLCLLDEYFPQLIDEGKVYWTDVPIFVFSHGKEFVGGNDMKDCPKGWECQPKKGLGSYTQPEVKRFITNPETRTLWRITRGDRKEAREALDLAFVSCGKEWVANKPKHMEA